MYAHICPHAFHTHPLIDVTAILAYPFSGPELSRPLRLLRRFGRLILLVAEYHAQARRRRGSGSGPNDGGRRYAPSLEGAPRRRCRGREGSHRSDEKYHRQESGKDRFHHRQFGFFFFQPVLLNHTFNQERNRRGNGNGF